MIIHCKEDGCTDTKQIVLNESFPDCHIHSINISFHYYSLDIGQSDEYLTFLVNDGKVDDCGKSINVCFNDFFLSKQNKH